MRLYNLLLETAGTAFVWNEHIRDIIITAFLSMVPTFEGRYAVVTGMGMGLPTLLAYVLAFVASSIPVPFIFLLLRPILDWFYTLPIAPVRKFAAWLEKRADKKRGSMDAEKKTGFRGWLNRHFTKEQAELFALYVFVALPVPGTGGWTGSLIATLFEMPRAKSMIAVILGNATACLIMTLATAGVFTIFG